MPDSNSEPKTPHEIPNVQWTLLRRRIHAWLEREAPSLTDVYEGALRLLFDKHYPGRVLMLSHAVREIQNSLPEIVLGIKRHQAAQSTLVKDLATAWKEHKLPLDTELADKAQNGQEGQMSIPLPVARLNMQLARSHQEPGTALVDSFARVLAYIAREPNPDNPSIATRARARQWKQIHGWFEVHRHHNRKREEVRVKGRELEQQFESFEAILGAPLQDYFDRKDKVDELLDETNKTSD